jgi:hypothetical protein
MIPNLENRGFDVIVDSGNVIPGDIETIFGNDENPNPPVNFIKSNQFTMLDLVWELGVFPSKSQMKKNWNGPLLIPDGFSEFTVGKFKKMLTIWNPTSKE